MSRAQAPRPTKRGSCDSAKQLHIFLRIVSVSEFHDLLQIQTSELNNLLHSRFVAVFGDESGSLAYPEVIEDLFEKTNLEQEEQ